MDGGGRLPRSVTAMARSFASPAAASVPPLLVGEQRTGRWLVPRRRSAAALPLAERIPTCLGSGLALAFIVAAGIAGAFQGGQFQTLRETQGEPRHMLARAFGFGIDRVTISGIAELSEIEVLVAAGIDPKISLAFFDAESARRRLEATPLIKQATVRKLYPGEISITLTEREPFALWQSEGQHFLIAADGAVIDRMDDGRFAHLPLVVGPEANLKVRDYMALRAEAGKLAPRIRAASLVAGRRWNLKLDNGLDVRLPEEDAKGALKRLVALETDVRLLEKDVLAIDLRQPDRVVMRLSEEAAAARAEQLKNRGRKKGGEA